MTQQLRIHNFTISLDGFAAGPSQDIDHPFGTRGNELHRWMFDEDNPDRTEWIERASSGAGATIMGRNMFGPVRDDWADESWQGWWGPNPPYHHPVFVLTNHPRASVTMQGGTTFHFVTDGIHAALDRAFAAADGHDVVLGGGVSTIHQYLQAGLVDYLHLVIVPILLGRGERLVDIDALADTHTCRLHPTDSVVHAEITKLAHQHTG